MVLSKRKRNGEFVVSDTSPNQSQMSMPQQADPSMMPPDTSRTRVNPRRSSRVAASSELPAKLPKPPAAKKARVSRAKQVSVPSQPTTSVLPVMPEAGSSEAAGPPPPKRGRKKADPAAEASGSQPEKRGAVYKAKCPQNILDRVERVMTQRCVVIGITYCNSMIYIYRIFMIDRNRIPGQLCEEFSVLGSTGNVGCFRKSDVEGWTTNSPQTTGVYCYNRS